MHDYFAVSALVARLARDPSLAGGIAEVRVRASPVFSPEALQQAYQMLTEDTPLSGSRLLVEELADRRECAQCGTGWTVDLPTTWPDPSSSARRAAPSRPSMPEPRSNCSRSGVTRTRDLLVRC